jgi:oxaloacetate decarboxylase alpha subunit
MAKKAARKASAARPSARPAAPPTKPRAKAKTPLRITDLTLRDAHQSLWATRMRTKDILGIIDVVDQVGYYSLEVWGGATFDVCLRFLRENPWERLRQIKARARKTPLQMLLRGQNLLGYRNYADDMVDRFVELACRNGVDIFRVFDALNDTRNLERAVKAVKRYGGHAQGTLCYTISPVHTVEKFVDLAREQAALGVDSLVIKDMAGLLSPVAAQKLVSALVREVSLPIQVHSHATSGMAPTAYFEAVKAGAGAIDCCISVMSLRTAHPPIESMLSMFAETEFDAGLDLDALREECNYFTKLWPTRAPRKQPINPIDPEILRHHIPGGMISNLRSQLEQQGALDRLDEVLGEVPRTRADMGYVPLVTPTSQIVGVQAVLNVLAGERYAMVTEETRNLVKGQYGRPPVPIKPEIRKKILGKEKPITCRPADLLEPMLPQATKHVDPPHLIESEEDIISYLMFPEPALEYFKWRALPTEERPSPPADREDSERAQTAEEAAPPPEPEPLFSRHDYDQLGALLHKVNELQFHELTVRRHDRTISLRASGIQVEPSGGETVAAPTPKPAPAPAAPPPATPEKPEPAGETINSPLSGTFYRSEGAGKPELAREGDLVSAGDPVCMVEAMKLFNPIKAPTACRVVKILLEHGAAVSKGDPLMAIEKV